MSWCALGLLYALLLQGAHDHTACPLMDRAGPCFSLMAGHLPWPLSLPSGWHFSPLPDKTNYYFSPKNVLIISSSSLQPKSHQSCFLLNSPWNLGIWFQDLSVLPLLFNIFFLYFNHILLSLLIWKCLLLTSLSECFSLLLILIVYVTMIVQLCHSICHIHNFDVQYMSYYCHRYTITFYKILLETSDSLKE